MGLRSQLLVVSLCTLLLPWAGCQYVQEMEGVLRENQSHAMIGQTALLARMLNQTVDLPEPVKGNLFYTPVRYQPVEMDGYDDDWQGHSADTLENAAASMDLRLQKGLHGNDLYLFLQLHDTRLIYHHPGQSFRRSDHVRVRTGSGKHELQWLFFTSGPGQLQVYEKRTGYKRLRARPEIDAWWQETGTGYQLEIRIPRKLIHTHLDIQVYDRDPYEKKTRLALSTRRGGDASVWVKPLGDLLPALQPWRTHDTDITLVDPRGWPLAPQKNWLNDDSPLDSNVTLDQGLIDQTISRFYRFLVEHLTPRSSHSLWPLPTQALSRLQQRIPLEKLDTANSRSASADWFRWPNTDRAALLVVQPVRQEGELKGYLLYTQTGEALVSMTNNALRRVTHRALLVMGIVVAVLILYASFLSWRIRQLKSRAEAAITSDGKVNQFTPSKQEDEIGDLSRSYHNLLQRVRNYTSYLETLGGKLAHELRTPLAIVKSSLELAQTSPGNNAEYLQRAQEGSERLRLILSAMSEASRVEQTIQQSDFQTFDLRSLVRDMAQAYGDTYTSHRFQSELPDVPAWVRGSPELIVQMLDKLADNARDFAPPDSTIEIAVNSFKNKWLLTVSNIGPTLPPNLEGQLFDSLVSQRDADHKGQSPHLGLGLYIVRLIAAAHEGQVEAHNRAQGDGVVFTVTLPAASAERN